MSPRWSPSGSVTLLLLPLCGLLVSLDQHGLLALCGWVPARGPPPVVMLLLLDLLINC